MISRRLSEGYAESLSIVPCPLYQGWFKAVPATTGFVRSHTYLYLHALKGSSFSRNILHLDTFSGFFHDLVTLLCHPCQKVLWFACPSGLVARCIFGHWEVGSLESLEPKLVMSPRKIKSIRQGTEHQQGAFMAQCQVVAVEVIYSNMM